MPLSVHFTIEGKYRTLNLRRHSPGCAVMFHDPDGVPCLLSPTDLRDLAQACERLATALEAEVMLEAQREAVKRLVPLEAENVGLSNLLERESSGEAGGASEPMLDEIVAKRFSY